MYNIRTHMYKNSQKEVHTFRKLLIYLNFIGTFDQHAEFGRLTFIYG